MPTILLIFGLRVLVYPNDLRPAHVHVQGKGCEAVELRENYGFSQNELNRISGALQDHLAMLCNAWRKIHGLD